MNRYTYISIYFNIFIYAYYGFYTADLYQWAWFVVYTEAGQCYCENLGQSPTDSSDVKTRRMDTNMGLLQGRVLEFYVSNRKQSAGQYIHQNVL